METDKQADYNANYVSRELFVNMSKEENMSEKMMEINLDENDEYEDEEPVDNTQD